MGNEPYNMEKRITDLEKKSEKLSTDFLNKCNEPNHSVTESLRIIEEKDLLDDKIKSLKQMNESRKNFSKNINLDEYRNEDGTFNVYKAKRPLNTKIKDETVSQAKILFHEGVGIGNDKKTLYFDYGVGEGDLQFRVWDEGENKENWNKVQKVGQSNATNEKVNDIFYGENCEEWTNRHDYKVLNHNCINFAHKKINELTDSNN